VNSLYNPLALSDPFFFYYY